jgi:hypothetical protein
MFDVSVIVQVGDGANVIFWSRTERIVKAMFDVSVIVQVGDGTNVIFWFDHWLDGAAMESMAPW